MKVDYDAKTDSLYVQFAVTPNADSSEVVGIDFEHAGKRVDLKALDAPHFPLT